MAGREQKRKYTQVEKRMRLRDEVHCVRVRPEFKNNGVGIDTNFILTEKQQRLGTV